MPRNGLFAATIVAIGLGLTVLAQQCEQSVYKGLDSRLIPKMLGKLPQQAHEIVGFEVANGRVFVATRNNVYGMKADQYISIPVPSDVAALATDKTGTVIIQTKQDVRKIGSDGDLVLDKEFSKILKGQVLDSGNDSLLDVETNTRAVLFTLRSKNGNRLPLATIPGKFRTASWNAFGLAAVVGNSLYYWPTGGKSLTRLATDTGLGSAESSCIVGDQRVVVGLRSFVVLIDHGQISILVGMQALCRFDKGILFMLDKERGLVWAVKGIEKVGPRKTDEEYAKSLLTKAHGKSDEEPSFLEAARTLGCQKARTIENDTAHR
jgi:hypothetical protein